MEIVLTSSSGKTLRKMKLKATNFDEITATTCCRLLRDVWSNDGETGEGYWQEDESEWLNWLKQEAEE